MEVSAHVSLRLLDHPAERKTLEAFKGPGVYIFLPESREVCEKKFHSSAALIDCLAGEMSVCYIGKAKKLNQRLKTYHNLGSASAGDWHKAGQLNEVARTLLLIPTPSHFDACLLELFLIRICRPELNFMSIQAGKLHFVQQVRESREIVASVRRRPNAKTWGCVRLKSELRAAFDALRAVIEFYDPSKNVVNIKPNDIGFPRRFGKSRLSLHVSAKNESIVTSLLRGQKKGVVDALWRSMRSAASEQQFHQAAQLRDLFLALRQLQFQLRRSRRILRRLRNNGFIVCDSAGNELHEFVIESFSITKIRIRKRTTEADDLTYYYSVLKKAVKTFNSDLLGEGDAERLRVNFEFLRLMLWWLDKQPEPCSTRFSGNVRTDCRLD
jgi:excinuclease UvrABC nuclease subunit